MFRVLYSQMALGGMDKRMLAEIANIKYNTLMDKLSGRTKFTLDECIAIKRALNSKLTIEELFELQEEKIA